MLKNKFKKAILIIIFLSFVLIFNVPQVYGLTVSKTGITSVGASTINITDIDWANPDSITVTGSFKYVKQDNRLLVYYNKSSLASGKTLSGTYTIVYKNVGYDANGDNIDLTVYSSVTTKNVYKSTVSWDTSEVYYGTAYLSNSKFVVISQPRHVEDLSDASLAGLVSNSSYLNTSQDFTITITKNGTSTNATGNYLFYVTDIDAVRTNGRYSEAIELVSGFSSTVYLAEDTTIDVSDDTTTYTGTTSDQDTEISSLTTLVTCPFTFTWYGASCGTNLFQNFNSSNIISRIYTSYDGGINYDLNIAGGIISATNITTNYLELTQNSNNEETITTYWKNSYEYLTQANIGYYLAKIIYDETTDTNQSYYIFEEVISEHTFDVYYIANTYNVSFDGNGATSGEMADMENLYYDKTYSLDQNKYDREGYIFIGWNTKSDGTGTSYDEEEEFKNLTSTNGETVILYAQWLSTSFDVPVTGGNGVQIYYILGILFIIIGICLKNIYKKLL